MPARHSARDGSGPWTAYPTPVVCASVSLGSAGLLPVLGAVRWLHHPVPALAAYCVLTALVSLRASLRSVPFAAVVAWMVYDGFVVHEQGELTWDGSADAYRLGLLAASSLLGTVVAALGRACGTPRA
ncbi:hypothetical protein AB0A69_14340 [Streptomyces sp. NPDC045431]|uniref:hypothetical protein n=1 Tax=Streptomyces sp. NPDC045431 TaxID=3155613 RepID=UPI0034022D4D